MQIESGVCRSEGLGENELVIRQSFSESNTIPVITVIIPAYNASDHLAKCFDSLKKQQFRDFEIIAVNDGSTDNTQQVLEYHLQLLDRPYTIVYRENGGVSAARNSGIEYARGRYLFFIDADDYLSSYCLLKLYNKMVEGSSDIAFCGFLRVDKAGRIIKGYRDSYSYLETVVESQRAITSFLRKEIWISVGCALYKKEIVDRCGLKFLEGCNYGEDQDFIIRYLSNSQSVSCVPEELMYYVSHSASATKKSDMSLFTAVDMWRDLGDYLKRKDLEHTVELIIYYRLPIALIKNSIALAKHKNQRKELINYICSHQIREEVRHLRAKMLRKSELRYWLYSRILLMNLQLFILVSRFLR